MSETLISDLQSEVAKLREALEDERAAHEATKAELAELRLPAKTAKGQYRCVHELYLAQLFADKRAAEKRVAELEHRRATAD